MTPAISMSAALNAPQIVSGASGYSSPAVKMGNLFQQIDVKSTGTISQQQFRQAFATMNPPARFRSLGANAIFSQLDPNHTGSVTKSNFVNGMTSLMKTLGSRGISSNAAASSLAVPPTSVESLKASLQSLLQTGNQSTGHGLVGSIVNTVT